jgi:hypothetical protein
MYFILGTSLSAFSRVFSIKLPLYRLHLPNDATLHCRDGHKPTTLWLVFYQKNKSELTCFLTGGTYFCVLQNTRRHVDLCPKNI